MAKTKDQKQVAVEKLTDSLSQAKGVVFATFTNVPMSGTEELRKKCRAEGIYYTVPKKTLANLALKHAGIDASVTEFEGNLSIAIAQDEVAPAQVLAGFAKEFEGFKIVGGILEKNFIAAAQVEALSKLPGKQQLRAHVVGTLQAPIAGFARVLQGNLSGLVRALAAIKETKTV